MLAATIIFFQFLGLWCGGPMGYNQIRLEDRLAWPSGMLERMEETTGGQEKQLENQRHRAVVQTRQSEWQALVLTDAAAFVHGQLSILWLVMALSCFEVRYSIKGEVRPTDWQVVSCQIGTAMHHGWKETGQLKKKKKLSQCIRFHFEAFLCRASFLWLILFPPLPHHENNRLNSGQCP